MYVYIYTNIYIYMYINIYVYVLGLQFEIKAFLESGMKDMRKVLSGVVSRLDESFCGVHFFETIT